MIESSDPNSSLTFSQAIESPIKKVRNGKRERTETESSDAYESSFIDDHYYSQSPIGFFEVRAKKSRVCDEEECTTSSDEEKECITISDDEAECSTSYDDEDTKGLKSVNE